MKWIKKNKCTVIVIVVFILLAFLAFKVKEIFFPNQRTAIYGDRLDGKVAVEDTTYDTVKEQISENETVMSVTVRENGRRIDITITVDDSVSVSDAKKLTDNITEPFTESQIGYYDFQVFIKKESSSEDNFPIIGYKQHNSASFSWSKDRDKTEEE
jgi:preprotein translocase subunit SecF